MSARPVRIYELMPNYSVVGSCNGVNCRGLSKVPSFDWRAAGLYYHSLKSFCQNTFGERVWKISVDAGLTCPNRDGHAGHFRLCVLRPGKFQPKPAAKSPPRHLVEGPNRISPRPPREGPNRISPRHPRERPNRISPRPLGEGQGVRAVEDRSSLPFSYRTTNTGRNQSSGQPKSGG